MKLSRKSMVCPKCAEYRLPFALAYEQASDHVGERLRVTCRRCGYAGYEDCADAAPTGGYTRGAVLHAFVIGLGVLLIAGLAMGMFR